MASQMTQKRNCGLIDMYMKPRKQLKVDQAKKEEKEEGASQMSNTKPTIEADLVEAEAEVPALDFNLDFVLEQEKEDVPPTVTIIEPEAIQTEVAAAATLNTTQQLSDVESSISDSNDNDISDGIKENMVTSSKISKVSAAVAAIATAKKIHPSMLTRQEDADFQDIDKFFQAINNETERRNRHDYHMLVFENDMFDENAKPTKHSAKRATIVERVEAVIINPERKLKKPLQRQDIFYLTYLLCPRLNCTITQQWLHLSNKTKKLIRLLWYKLLPQSLTDFIHTI